MHRDWMSSYFRQITESFSKEEPFEPKLEGREGPARRNSKCKGPVAETSVVVLGTAGRACVVGLYVGEDGGRKEHIEAR